MPAAKEKENFRDIKSLFRWSTEQEEKFKEADAKLVDKKLEELTPERRAFLENALNDLTTDEIKQMQDAVALIHKNDAEVSFEEKVDALELLQDLVESIDNAADLCTIGGFASLVVSLQSESGEVRAATLSVIATLTQNNPGTQSFVSTHDGLNLLLSQVSHEELQVRRKALHALSALLRNNPTSALKTFVADGGFDILLKFMQKEPENFQARVLFLLFNLCHENADYVDIVIEKGFIPLVTKVLDSNDSMLREQASRFLLQLVAFPKAREAMLQDDLKLKGKIAERAKALKAEDDALEEEISHIKDLQIALG